MSISYSNYMIFLSVLWTLIFFKRHVSSRFGLIIPSGSDNGDRWLQCCDHLCAVSRGTWFFQARMKGRREALDSSLSSVESPMNIDSLQ